MIGQLLAATLLLALDPATATLGVIVGGSLLALFMGKGGKKKKKKPAGPASNCPPLPWLDPEEVAALVAEGAKEGVRGVMPFVSYCARHLYPTKADGTPISWPTKAPFVLPVGTDGALVCRWEELRTMIEGMEIPLEVDPKPGDIISDLIKPFPLPGYFYQIKNGDTLEKIVKSALNSARAGMGNGFQKRLRYIKQCVNVGQKWNLRLYGSTMSSKAFPEYYLTDGQGMAAAFLPRHQNALAAVLAGKYPARAISASGGKLPGMSQNIWGMIWLPPLDEAAMEMNEPVCAGTWEDGSPTTDPPPALLGLLQG